MHERFESRIHLEELCDVVLGAVVIVHSHYDMQIVIGVVLECSQFLLVEFDDSLLGVFLVSLGMCIVWILLKLLELGVHARDRFKSPYEAKGRIQSKVDPVAAADIFVSLLPFIYPVVVHPLLATVLDVRLTPPSA